MELSQLSILVGWSIWIQPAKNFLDKDNEKIAAWINLLNARDLLQIGMRTK